MTKWDTNAACTNVERAPYFRKIQGQSHQGHNYLSSVLELSYPKLRTGVYLPGSTGTPRLVGDAG
jgi:hypothetical protein